MGQSWLIHNVEYKFRHVIKIKTIFKNKFCSIKSTNDPTDFLEVHIYRIMNY